MECPVCRKNHTKLEAVLRCKESFMKKNENISNIPRNEVPREVIKIFAKLSEMIKELS